MNYLRGRPAMSDTVNMPTAFKPKKSVALSGVTAGNTALCTVGRSGNDLHYRGYDILDIAEKSEFEEIAYLLVYGKLPNRAELAVYKTKLQGLRGIPAAVRITSIGCEAGGSASSTCFTEAGSPRSACSFAL